MVECAASNRRHPRISTPVDRFQSSDNEARLLTSTLYIILTCYTCLGGGLKAPENVSFDDEKKENKRTKRGSCRLVNLERFKRWRAKEKDGTSLESFDPRKVCFAKPCIEMISSSP